VTRIKVVPAAADDMSLTPDERGRGAELAGKLAMRVLSRSWQILFKGFDEVAQAGNALQAAEMVLVRLAYAADLPTPDELAAKFSGDRATAPVTDLGKGQVYLAAQRLKEKANITIAIEGHTDDIGNSEYNEKLGMRRAETVAKELASLGVDPGRMSAASVGEAKPLIGQDTGWARAVNRRVEFQVKDR
jgi:hypothetical protein